MDTNEHIRLLIEKVLSGNATAEELQQLKLYLESDPENMYTGQIESILEKFGKEKHYKPYDKAKWEGIADELIARATSEEKPEITMIPSTRRRSIQWMGWAAAILLVVASGTYLLLDNRSKEQQPLTQTSAFGDDVLPGQEGAILQLGDGTKIILDSAANGQLAKEGNVNIIKSGGELSYQSSGDGGGISWNAITTPKGRQYQLILDDGTHVWLNANSSLEYPSKFSGNTREVKMTGEVYFEVAKNAGKPFLVAANETKIQVLGTHFNVNAYGDEPTVQTTLAEGSVKVSHGAGSRIIKPGQQAIVNKQKNSLDTRQANISKALAWKNGVFSFEHADIYSVMRQLSRWYDVEIEYTGNLDPTDEFGGKIPRRSNLSKVLELLQATKAVRFVIKGNKVTVMPYQ